MFFGTQQQGQRRAPFVGAAKPAVSAGWFCREEAIMGTAIRVELWCERARRGRSRDGRGDGRDAPHRPRDEPAQAASPNCRASTPARPAAPVRLSDEMFRLVERALHFSRLSGGAFDISYAGVGQLYDYRAGRAAQRRRDRAGARQSVGYQHLVLDPSERTLRFGTAGHAHRPRRFRQGPCRRHARPRSCARRGIRHAIVSAGGDSRVIGDRRGRPWSVGHPRPAPARRGGGGAAAGRRRRSRPRATTNASSRRTANAATT